MKGKYFILLIFAMFVGTVFLTGVGNSFMPPTHRYITEQVLSGFTSDSQLYQDCVRDPELCFAGNIMSDISVVYYYTAGHRYEITHQPSFCQSMLDQATSPDERTCAVGACMHQTQDLVSHQQMVEYAIQHTGISNAIIHVFAEQHEDNYVQQVAPGVREKALNITRFNECWPLMKRVLTSDFSADYGGIAQTGELDTVKDKFLDEISTSVTSYDVAFKSKNGLFDNLKSIPVSILAIYVGFMLLWTTLIVLLVFKKDKGFLNYFSILLFCLLLGVQLYIFIGNLQGSAFTSFIRVISPFANFVPIGDSNSYILQAVANGRDFLTRGEVALVHTDASGFDKLHAADVSVTFLDYIIVAVLVIALITLIYYNFKKKKSYGGYNLI